MASDAIAEEVEAELEAVGSVYLDDLEDGVPAFDAERACCFRIRIMPDVAGEDALVCESPAPAAPSLPPFPACVLPPSLRAVPVFMCAHSLQPPL